MVENNMSFEQLCLLFVSSLLDKAHAYDGGDLSKFQRSRLGEAMTADIRKLGDMVFPAARIPRISAAADEASDSLGVDLRHATWHSQKKIDNYKTFTYEHLYPVREIRAALAKASNASEALQVLDQMLWIAWITKDEDKRLRGLGFGSIRENPLQAYKDAGIELLPREVGPAADGEERDCASCGRTGSWLVTGAVHSNAPGRLLVYCDSCRQEKGHMLGVALPLGAFDRAPATLLTILYEGGVTRSDPEQVAEMLGIPGRGWIDAAQAEYAGGRTKAGTEPDKD